MLTLSLRQHRVSDQVRGRVSAAYTVLSVGGAAVGSVLGSVLGGVLVHVGGLTTPMWFGAGVVSVVFAVSVPALRQSAMQLETSPKQ